MKKVLSNNDLVIGDAIFYVPVLRPNVMKGMSALGRTFRFGHFNMKVET